MAIFPKSKIKPLDFMLSTQIMFLACAAGIHGIIRFFALETKLYKFPGFADVVVHLCKPGFSL